MTMQTAGATAFSPFMTSPKAMSLPKMSHVSSVNTGQAHYPAVLADAAILGLNNTKGESVYNNLPDTAFMFKDNIA